MGSQAVQDGGCGDACPEGRQHEEEPGHLGAKHAVSRRALGIPSLAQPECPAGTGSCGVTMADASELAPRGCLSGSEHLGGIECLEPVGSQTEEVQCAALSLGHLGPQRPEELVIPNNGDGLCFVLSQIMLDNPASYCYANAAVMATLWGFGAMTHFEWSMSALLSASMIAAENLVTLIPSLFADWNGDGPADASEFALHFLTWCQPQCLLGTWSRRLDNGEEKAQKFDQGALTNPLTLQNETAARHVTLQFLLDAWTKEHGMCAGLDKESSLLCLHIDRFFLDSAGNRGKFCFQVDIGPCLVPLFNSDGLDTTTMEYIPVSMVIHAGDAHAGHYRALMRMHSGHTVDEDEARQDSVWAYTDDNVPAEILTSKSPGSTLLQNVVLIWMVRKPHVNLWRSLHTPADWPLFIRELKKWQHEQIHLRDLAQRNDTSVGNDPMAAILAALPAL